MNLSNDLVSQFAKITKDDKETKKESIVYGKAIVDNGVTYVQIDGSDRWTPVSTTTTIKSTDKNNGERVTIMIKDHSATIIGNTSSPAATSSDVNEIISNLDIIVADKVTTDMLEAERARIDELVTDNAVIRGELKAGEAEIDELQADNVTINEKLTANEADISKLKTDKLDASVAEITYATIEDLEATDAKINNLDATYASVEELEAVHADIIKLEADIGDIDSLMFGSASGTTIQTSFSNAVIAQLGNAQIKSAMIDNVSADKISAGDIITNDIRVLSEDGKLLISDETIQISDEARVRVQIGKDASGDYSINIWDPNGNLMFSKGGITDSAIKKAIIRNNMISDDANISAHKLDIDSLFDEINDSTKTIKSTRVYLDEEKQSLDVAFKTVSSDVEELQNGMTSQGTQITAIQGQIEAKIWEQDVDAAKTEMSTKYTTLQQNLNSFQTTVGNTYATKTDLSGLVIGGRNLIQHSADLSKANVGGNWRVVEQSDGYNTLSINSTATTWEECQIPLYAAYNELRGPVTVSFEFNQSSNNLLSFNVGAYSGAGARLKEILNFDAVSQCTVVSLTDEWSRAYYTFNIDTINDLADAESYKIQFKKLTGYTGTINVRKPKLESGNKVTAWTPAPEDVESKIISAETKITQNTDTITAIASKTDANESSIASLELATDGLTAKVNAAKKQKCHEADGTAGTAGYVGFCTITVTGTYVNVPITFALSNRGQQSSNVSFCLSSINDKDPSLSHIQSDGGIKIWAYKSETSKWILIAQKSEGWDVIYVNDYSCPRSGLSLSWSDIQYDSLPTSNITEATLLAGKLTKTTVDNAAKTATNYLNFSGNGLVVGNHTASSLGKNVLIDDDSVDVRNGSTTLASFGAKTITLGQNAEDSVIDLCDGAGRISANTAQAATSYPNRNAILIDSQEIETESVRFNAKASNEYGASSTPTIVKGSEVYLSRSTGTNESCARVKAEHKTTSSGAYNSSGISAMTYDDASKTRAMVFASDSANSNHNQVNVYPTKTTINKPLFINGTEFTGSNKVLWSGGYYMSSSHTATLSEAITSQANGIVVVFSEYKDGASANLSFHCRFIPKTMISKHGGVGHVFQMSVGALGIYATKLLYVSDTKITGHDVNDDDETARTCGITSTNKHFVLRYVIGV